MNQIERNLIFDLGVNHGDDTEFYLAKGFRVVGVEADPIIAQELGRRFAAEIADGRFVLEAVGILDKPGQQTFYRNIFCDHWSSFDPGYGCRGDTQFETILVECKPISYLFEKYGYPYYLKVDIEGADQLVLKQLRLMETKPTFVSVEEFGLATINLLYSLGFNMFSLRRQQDKSWAHLPNPPREGVFVERAFTQRDSGPFGLEVPEWMPVDKAQRAFNQLVRDENNNWLPPPGEWYDLHATFWPRTIDDEPLDLAR